jgi:1,4-alpha-glucan branching enzyme
MRSSFRHEHFEKVLSQIEDFEHGIDRFSMGYKRFGFVIHSDKIVYSEWAPNAKEAYLIGDFSPNRLMQMIGIELVTE